MTARLIVASLICGCGATQAERPPPLVEIGDPARADFAEEVAPTEAVPEVGCVDRLLRGEKLYKQPPPEDETLFRSALDAIAGGDVAGGRKSLFAIVDRYKNSPFRPLSYLHFGELMAAEAQKDETRGELAMHFYRETLKYRPEENDAHFYAALRLAELEQSRGDHQKALVHFRSVAQGESRHHDLPCMAELASQARTGIVVSYAHAGNANRAFDFFRVLSGDRNGPPTRTLRMLVDLVDALAARESADAMLVARDVVLRRPDEGTCRALEAVVRRRAFLQAQHAAELVRSCLKR